MMNDAKPRRKIAFYVFAAVGALWLGLRMIPQGIQVVSLYLENLAVGAAWLLVFFLTILIIRYVLFLALGYLHSVQSDIWPQSRYHFRFSVLIPAFNEGKLIDKSIASVLEMEYQNYEVIVIDDGSTDDTYEHAKKWEGDYGKAQVRVLRKANGGKARALNCGIAAATGELIFCMDGDSRLAPQTLRVMARRFQDKSVGAVAGRVHVANMDTLLTKLQELEYIQGLNFCRRAESFMSVVDTVPGPCGAFRRDVLLDCGGYDSDTFAEDCDITLKILRRGWRVVYEPEALAVTEAPEGILNVFKQRYRWTRGKIQSVNKHRSALWHPAADPLYFFISLHLVFESVVWPVMNIFANLYFIWLGWMYGLTTLLLFWWVQWTLLDVAAAIYCVAMDEERLALVPFALLYRIGYIYLIDICKLFATCEEFIGLKMDWGKLERQGKLGG
ncbi:MAG: glycosyltransferase family 2 protein [Acidobacteria bacterium]|nr:glycosyltransferase family 2 protein [Acidobacteriota bacterium]MBI3655737.1 glycosyltransferase family 2 protein [Acidobacteriota bacterium]